MTMLTAVVVYFLIWWTVLFAVLPVGVRPDSGGQETTGNWRGAPLAARIGAKMLATTLIAGVIFAGVWWLIQSEYLSFRSGWLAMPVR
ncbi:DUF1467 family protein [Humitalea sp. 24SJ18S-53]|uniref:DUF1467 family protein n=1 Tax=Humitalea sp. 24SJ18S-53 TaxID=3422307 RepID=UPI003D67593A